MDESGSTLVTSGANGGEGSSIISPTGTGTTSNDVASISVASKSAAFKRRLAEDLFPLHQVKSISSINSEFGEDAMSESSTLETTAGPHPSKSGSLVNPSQGLLSNVWHTQLALWTFTLSTVLTTLYRGKCRPQTIIFACFTLTAAFFVSWALVILVVAAHLFNTRKNFFALAVFRQRQTMADPNPVLTTGGHQDEGWVSPQKSYRSMSTSSQCSSLLGSVPGSGACSPTGWKKQPIFWQRKMSVEQTYFGTITPTSRL